MYLCPYLQTDNDGAGAYFAVSESAPSTHSEGTTSSSSCQRVGSSKEKSPSPHIAHLTFPGVRKFLSGRLVKGSACEFHFVWLFILFTFWVFHGAFCLLFIFYLCFGLGFFIWVKINQSYSQLITPWGKYCTELINHEVAEIPEHCSCSRSERELIFLFSGESYQTWRGHTREMDALVCVPGGHEELSCFSGSREHLSR